MNEIRGDDRTVKVLLSDKYKIDYYQRDYNWETKQVKELIDDLTNRFSNDFKVGHSRQKVRNYGQYFLGSVIISKKDDVSFIIDGQQRLTTLTLLLIYLNGIQKGWDSDDQVYVDNLIYSTQYGIKSFNMDIDERKDIFEKLQSGEEPVTVGKSQSIQNLVNRYKDLENSDLFSDDFRERNQLPHFLEWLTEKVVFVVITTASDDEAYTIFETMNDRGLSLTPTDMLKGYFLANITDDSERQKASDILKDYQNVFLEKAKDEYAKFFKAWLRSQYAETIRERKRGAQTQDFEKLGTEFHRWLRDNERREGIELISSKDFFTFIDKNLSYYAEAYLETLKYAKIYNYDYSSIFFNEQNNFTLQYPLLLAPLRTEDDTQTRQNKMKIVSRFIEILLVRRIFNFKTIDHSSMEYKVFQILKKIRGKSIDELKNLLINELENYEFDFSSSNFSLRNNRKKVHLVLARLTEFIEYKSGCTTRFVEYSNQARSKGGYQIEHVLPNDYQKFSEEFSDQNTFQDFRNLIGGLLLIPGKENASLGNKPFEEKVEIYSRGNLLASSLHKNTYKNNPAFMNFITQNSIPFEPKTEFNKKQLLQRQNLYIKIANLCWSPERIETIGN